MKAKESLTLCLVIIIQFILYKLTQGYDPNVPPYADQCGILEEIPGDIRTQLPWVVAIFHRNGPQEPYKFILPGTIIAPTAIISLVGGAFGGLPRGSKGKYSLFKPEDLLVGVSMNSTNLNNTDEHTQLLEVNYVMPEMHLEPDNPNFHFIIFHLKNPIKKLGSPYARIACQPPESYASRISHYDGWDLMVGGYARPKLPDGSYPLKLIEYQVGVQEQCENILNFNYKRPGSHIFCAHAKDPDPSEMDTCFFQGSPKLTPIDSGQGRQIFFGGILALIPSLKWGTCNLNSTYFIASALHNIKWIFQNMECSPNGFACEDGTCIPLKSLCNRIQNCPAGDMSDENPVYCAAAANCDKGELYQCGKCLRKYEFCDGRQSCEDGSDEDPAVCARIGDKIGLKSESVESSDDKCEPIKIPKGVVSLCKDAKNQTVDCTRSLERNSRMYLACKKHHISKFKYSYAKMTCEGSGVWNPLIPFDCELDCGMITQISKNRILPWDVGIFLKERDSYKSICGGSLIAENAVTTSAHCLLDDDSGEEINLADLKIVISPISESFDENLKSNLVQISDASEVWIHPDFKFQSFNGDIGVVQLSSNIKFGPNALPVCSFPHKSLRRIPSEGSLGLIDGFNPESYNSVIGTQVKFTSLPVIPKDLCKYSFREYRLNTTQTFCAGYPNGQGSCKGKDGSGFYFLMKSSGKIRYYLKGISTYGGVDKEEFCASKDYSVFTHLDSYRKWIFNVIANMERIF